MLGKEKFRTSAALLTNYADEQKGSQGYNLSQEFSCVMASCRATVTA